MGIRLLRQDRDPCGRTSGRRPIRRARRCPMRSGGSRLHSSCSWFVFRFGCSPWVRRGDESVYLVVPESGSGSYCPGVDDLLSCAAWVVRVCCEQVVYAVVKSGGEKAGCQQGNGGKHGRRARSRWRDLCPIWLCRSAYVTRFASPSPFQSNVVTGLHLGNFANLLVATSLCTPISCLYRCELYSR